ncbi:PAS domain-containing protein [Flavobacterium sp. NRK F10]|uniref:Histidine kinase n=1 Tax=Flavobacterium sediminis TaxID=2201181 RepID=A0A2U8QWS5_9FLAO|nr:MULTISPECIES: PAS domain-containing protein [Flavobacterium]AWM14334.1 histidine kinase [Flavobacterium sediminis]MCO6175552.1 PAS domain-containing protein [Flavobacterium sp. NRK F10]
MEEIQRPTPIDKEVVWDKSKILMSKTDKFGTIEYANDAFVDVSGYEDYELVGKPHNIIRHPDMPKVIFKVLWDNLKKGNNFHAIVKNLAKSGRYYWVITDYEVVEDQNGEIINYIGRRTAVPDDVVSKSIEPLYKKLLQIEEASGVESCEKYLTGFLEEEGKSYDEYVLKLLADYEKTNNPQPIVEEKEEKGFFGKLFGR